jgi:chromate transport protein ChrA
MLVDLINNITTDFLYFSFIEAIIFCYYFNKIGKCGKFVFADIVIIGFSNCLISQLFPPILYQLLMIITMGCYLYLFKSKGILYSLFLSMSAMIFILVVEMIMAIGYELIFGFSFTEISKFKIFITILPMKIVEALMIKGGGILMKAWYGEIEKRK